VTAPQGLEARLVYTWRREDGLYITRRSDVGMREHPVEIRERIRCGARTCIERRGESILTSNWIAEDTGGRRRRTDISG
jgi:hypothetical protein